jgi:hypothetical protein
VHCIISPISCQVKGSRGSVIVDSLMISNIDFTSALLQIYFTGCDDIEEDEEATGNAYFVSIGFFDSDSSYVFGHSFFFLMRLLISWCA